MIAVIIDYCYQIVSDVYVLAFQVISKLLKAGTQSLFSMASYYFAQICTQ